MMSGAVNRDIKSWVAVLHARLNFEREGTRYSMPIKSSKLMSRCYKPLLTEASVVGSVIGMGKPNMSSFKQIGTIS